MHATEFQPDTLRYMKQGAASQLHKAADTSTMAAPLGLTSRILVAILHCWVAAIAPVSCSAGFLDRGDVIGFSFPSTEGPEYDGREFKFSWDAGVLGRALHLTADGVYEPPVAYSPDPKRSAGHVSLSQGIPLALELSSFDYNDGRLLSVSSQEASFNTSFTMSVSRPHDYKADDGGLLFEVMPQPEYLRDGLDRAIYTPLSSTPSDSNISVEIGRLEYYYHQGLFGLYVSILPPATANYTVWIDYDAKIHILSVYVDDRGRRKPGQATHRCPLIITAVVSKIFRRWGWEWDPEWASIHGGGVRSPDGGSCFGLFASKDRLSPSCQPVVYSWNLTVDRLSSRSTSTSFTDGGRRRRARVFFYLALVAAPAAAIIFLGAWCLVSRYRSLRMKLKLNKAMRRLPGIPREFRYAAVKKATRNFDESMRLGSGGFGAVYKGAMIATCDGDDGQQRLQYVEVAVKKFTRKDNCSYDDFLAEVAVINRLRHKNIVPLIGWCYENGELLLIYQYMPNGSLDQHLFREKRHQQLPILQWQTRYDVIKDIAAGLHYVHHEYERAVLHRDIKASNIMLDADFRGRLGDFGLARVVAFDKTSFTDMGVAGTWGFIAPEYAVSHKATRQTDVYAFGVLVLEVVTGKRSLGAADSAFPLLMDWVWWLHGEGRLLEAVEDELTTMADFSSENATRLLLLGLACSDPNPSGRPSMDQVVQVIAKSMPPPSVPLVKPAFVWPPEGEQLLMLSDDDADDEDDFVESDHRDSDRRHWEETEEHCDSLATGIKPSSEITQRKSRNVAETNINQDIEKCV